MPAMRSDMVGVWSKIHHSHHDESMKRAMKFATVIPGSVIHSTHDGVVIAGI